LVAEHLERCPPVGNNGRLDSDVDAAVVHEPPQVRILDPGVRHEEDQTAGAVFGDDPMGGCPTPDAA